MMETTRRLALTVGALVIVTLVTAFAIVIAIVPGAGLLGERVTYHAAFRDVAGLREGAAVRLGGRDVGTVTRVAFDRDDARRLVVTFTVGAGDASRVREDSVARISSQGLLGDKLIEVALGDPARPAVADGGWVRTEEPIDPSRLVSVVTEGATHARDVLARLERATRGLGTDEAGRDARELLASLRRIVARIETGPGLAHELLYGEGLAADARRATDALAEAGEEVAGTARAAGRVARALRLERPAPDLLVNASRAADTVADVAGAVDAAALRRASRDLAAVAADLRAGRGTLGALIMDPTLYEETKRILVNVRRNRVLRALARFVIAEDDGPILDGRPGTVTVVPRRGPGPPVDRSPPRGRASSPGPTKRR